jgi:hypothetical protein
MNTMNQEPVQTMPQNNYGTTGTTGTKMGGRGSGSMRMMTASNPCWRLMQLISTVIAFSVMIAAEPTLNRYSRYAPYLYLVVATVMAAAYSLLMLLVDCLLAARGTLIPMLAASYLTAFLDLLFMILCLTAGAAAYGGDMIRGSCAPGLAAGGTFCTRVEVAAAFALFAGLMYLPSLISSSTAITQNHLANRGTGTVGTV